VLGGKNQLFDSFIIHIQNVINWNRTNFAMCHKSGGSGGEGLG
jgi:hypothetical protein